ncbi:MAG: hypothetical protein Q8Q92_02515 [bacterium]|nr:hypothetical protein [bacterium]
MNNYQFQKMAVAYLKEDGRVFLYASSITTTGERIGTPPLSTTDRTNPNELGKRIAETLNGSKEKVLLSNTLDEFVSMLKFAGAKSWSSFIKSTKHALIVLENDRVSFSPSKLVKRAFMYTGEKLRSSLAPDELGKTLLAAFNACE